jgi:protein-S-isoprenylcysteine O-methyltransferase Ste14
MWPPRELASPHGFGPIGVAVNPLPFTDTTASVLFTVALAIVFLVQLRSGSGTLLRRAPAGETVAHVDHGSLGLVALTTGLGIVGAVASATRILGATIATEVPAVRWVVFALGIAAIVGGAAFRLWAVLTLGRFFTLDVRVASDQTVVSGGPYRWVRHPSYTGLLLSLLGFGLTLGNWLSVLCIVVLPLIGLVRRILVEEGALFAGLGEPYREFAAHRKRLVPGLW